MTTDDADRDEPATAAATTQDTDGDLQHMATILQELAALVAAATGDERATAIEQHAAKLREQLRQD